MVACVVLVAWTFGPTVNHEFTNLDDDQVIVNNPHYRGLGADRLQWMFTTRWMGQYQPVTWISYAADMLVAGHSARTYHTVNVVWHCAATAALFLLIRMVIGRRFVGLASAACRAGLLGDGPQRSPLGLSRNSGPAGLVALRVGERSQSSQVDRWLASCDGGRSRVASLGREPHGA